MSTHPFADRISIAAAALEPWPLPPESIVSGKPDASGAVFSKSADGRSVRALWDCTPGSFRWTWTYDETLVVVTGRAIVRLDDGRVVDIRAGDLAYFERGQAGIWETVEHLRKAFHAESPDPLGF